ncbi:hypothetical protein B296_00025185 [Ensete ventricosum]|uniref:Uncharacterized protein n=1 Tax=Ensete ventricosum TaxID=4639 RepID=A0A426Z2T7_ENSVE|nr:hypothetical protein B296_00025185 [Ensete ventricosum]
MSTMPSIANVGHSLRLPEDSGAETASVTRRCRSQVNRLWESLGPQVPYRYVQASMGSTWFPTRTKVCISFVQGAYTFFTWNIAVNRTP